ncbi:MAG: ABC transporter substrate-binding protein [Acidimicrobiaceae bacterium]|nr:ABC transporter substrate-binding protein [Acidimicrobiaceae bacterium]
MAHRTSPLTHRTKLAQCVGIAVVLVALAACGGESETATTEAPTTEAPTTTAAPATTEAPTTTAAPATTEAPTTTAAPVTTAAPSLTVTDGSGREITLDRPAERIVCVQDNCTDLTSDLGIVPVAQHRGGEWGTAAAYYGTAAADIPVLGDRTSVEEVAAFEPDLIIGRVGEEEVRDALEMVAPVYLVDIGGVQTLKEGWTDIGILTGRQAEAEEAIHRFEHNVEHLAEDLPADAVNTRVAVGFGDTNWMIWDSSSFCRFLHDEGAGTCVFPAQPESEYGSPDSEFAWEFIVEADPEVWVMITWEGSARADSVTEPAWLETTAHREGRICNEDSAGSFGHGLLMLQWAYQCYLNAGWPSIYDHPGDLAVWLPEDH